MDNMNDIEEIDKLNQEDLDLYDSGEFPSKEPFTDDKAWASLSRADWRYLDGNEYKVISELTYQQCYNLKRKKDPRYKRGIARLAHDLTIGRQACTRAVNSLESKWHLIGVDRRRNAAWIIKVLRAPNYDLPAEFPVPEVAPRKRTDGPTLDPVTGEILPRQPGKQCAGITVKGERCIRNTRVGNYCVRHLDQDPCIGSIQPLASNQYNRAIDPCIESEPEVPIVREIVRDSERGSPSAFQPLNASGSQIAPREKTAEEFLSEHPELNELNVPVTFAQRAVIVAEQRRLKYSRESVIDLCALLGFVVESSADLTERQAEDLIEALKAQPDPEREPELVGAIGPYGYSMEPFE
jgi:hypothetical protein